MTKHSYEAAWRTARAVLLMSALSLALPSCMDLEMAKPLVEVKGPVLSAADAAISDDVDVSPKPTAEPSPEPKPSAPNPSEGAPPTPMRRPEPGPVCAPVSAVVSDSSLVLCVSGDTLYEPALTWWTATSSLL